MQSGCDALSQKAIRAAIAVAEEHRIRCEAPETLADGSNVLLRLAPHPVVARIATTTGLVRRPIEKWLALDLDIAEFLLRQNFPVVAPSRELPAGPHLRDGFGITFWQYVAHEKGYRAQPAEVGPRLRELHEVLRGYRGELRALGPVAEIPGWLDNLECWNVVAPSDLAMLRRGYAETAAAIEALDLRSQPLHGDAHAGNLLKTEQGLLWTDFEDACLGPVEWDLACFLRTAAMKGVEALAMYADGIDFARLRPFLEARDLQGAVWMALLAMRFPDRKARAAEWMEKCRACYG